MKLGKVTSNDPAERLNLSFHQSTVKQLEAYREYYKQIHGEPIERSQLLEEIAKCFFREDRAFQKFLAASAAAAATSPASAPAAGVPAAQAAAKSAGVDTRK